MIIFCLEVKSNSIIVYYMYIYIYVCVYMWHGSPSATNGSTFNNTACWVASTRVPNISSFVEYVRRLRETYHESSPQAVAYYAVLETHYAATSSIYVMFIYQTSCMKENTRNRILQPVYLRTNLYLTFTLGQFPELEESNTTYVSLLRIIPNRASRN